jgi:phosphomannomutase
VNREIFKEYDIRGIYPTEVDEEAAAAIGRTLPRFFGGGAIVACHDIRNGSTELYCALTNGLREVGVGTVVEVGLATTPMLYFLVNDLGAAGGVIVTASHSPPEHNGFKVVREYAIPVSGKELWSFIATI